MPLLTYTQENLPTPTEFRADLDRVAEMANPIDDLCMPSSKFYQLFQEGVLDEELQHCFSWFATYDIYLKEKRTLEATLMRAALQTTLLEESQDSQSRPMDFFPHRNSVLEEVAA